LQNVDRRIPISIHHRPTMRAGMRAVAQCLGNHFAAARTQLGGIARVYQYDTSASFCIQPSALLKLLLQDTPLAVGEIDAVFEGFSRYLSIVYCYLKRNSCANHPGCLKPLKQVKGLYPGVLWASKAPGTYNLSVKIGEDC
jgi:hypothetical protein